MNKVERDQHRRDMKHPRTRIRRVLTAPLMDGEVSIAAEHKKWHDAFGAVVAGILAGKHHMKRHSDGETPWQFALADYRVLFSDKTPRGTERKDGGSWGIYLRDYNVRVATFAPNSAFLRNALSRMFDASHALSESWKAAEQQIVSPQAAAGVNHYRRKKRKTK